MNYCQVDSLGSITSLSNSSAAISAAYSYDSFGNLSVSTGSTTNPFGYTGRESDLDTSLYYYRARYYAPVVGRFLSEDPIRFESGVNFYSYVNNRPIVSTDPFGLFSTQWHRENTYRLGRDVFGPKCESAARMVADANAAVDYPWWSSGNPFGDAWRYGGPHFPIGNYAEIALSNSVSVCDIKALGRALHTLQDGFTHPSGVMGPTIHILTFTLFDYAGGPDAAWALGATRSWLQSFKDKCLPCCTGGSDSFATEQ